MNNAHAPVPPKPHVLLVSEISAKHDVMFIDRHKARAMCNRGRLELVKRKAEEGRFLHIKP